jgi:ABC-2 type transport system ATP-binding protein
MAQQAVIKTNQLSKIYNPKSAKQTIALENLSLDVQKGEIFGFLGPNGAGKTTTIRLLLDLIRPTNGSATIFGKDVRQNSVEIHKSIGFLPGELNLWKGRTAQEVVNYLASVRGNAKEQVKEARILAERLKFDLSKKVRDYSTGNKRKLGLIIALMHKPELLILDEPTSGLDPLMQQIFNQMMLEVKQDGRTVFLSSHVLSEVQAICDRVGILRDGQLKAVENIEKLTKVDFRQVEMRFRDTVPQAWQARLMQLEGVKQLEMNGNTLKMRLIGDFDPLLRAVSDGYIEDIHVHEPSLEDIFLAFYGNSKDTGIAKKVEEMA